MSQSSFAPKTDISRIDRYAPAELIGREAELKLLDDAWAKAIAGEPKRPHVLTFVALGGEGKTSLVAKWLAQLAHQDWPGCDAVFAWSFYSQGTRDQLAASSDLFLFPSAIDQWGFAAVEAMASGLPALLAAGSGVATRMADCPGLRVLPGGDPHPWAETIVELWASAERRAAMGQAARAYVEAQVPSWREVLCQDLLPVWQAAAGRRR